MAKLLEALPAQIRAGRTEMYPWADWFDGQARALGERHRL